jgi:hypothetical protein
VRLAAVAAGVPAYPLALYLDGVQCWNRDGVIGFYLWSMTTGIRHLLCVLQKSTLCCCGCRGWCSLWPVWQMLRWSFECLANGVYPQSRHDGAPWREAAGDSIRAAMSGTAFAFRCPLVMIKGDMMEHVTSIGLTHFVSVGPRHPCAICDATLENMHDLGHFSVLGVDRVGTDYDEYEAACHGAEIHVHILSQAQHRIILAELVYDKGGNADGRCVSIDLPMFGLLKWDRLEPSIALVDVSRFDTLDVFPITITFWRLSAITCAKHRNPIFDRVLGTSPFRSIAADWLHCLSLGPFQLFLVLLIHRLIEANAWGIAGGSMEARYSVSMNMLVAEMQRYYEGRPQATRASTLTVSMIGTIERPTMRSETNHIIPFCAILFERYGHVLDRRLPAYKRLGREMEEVMRLIHAHPWTFSIAAVQARR